MHSGILEFLRGATMMAELGIALFFIQYWGETKDRIFIYFSAAFVFMAVSQIVVVLFGEGADFAPFAYLLRVAAFLLIIFAIVDKNLPKKPSPKEHQ